MVSLAQLVRALRCGRKGSGFDPPRTPVFGGSMLDELDPYCEEQLSKKHKDEKSSAIGVLVAFGLFIVLLALMLLDM